MLTPPADLAEDLLVSALERGWRLGAVASLAYRPEGFGSHHWDVTDSGGTRWFATVDELVHKRRSRGEPLDAAFGRLRGALAAAVDLRAQGRTFVVAPVPGRDGGPVARLGEGFAVALYPYVDGRAFEWGGFATPEHRRAVLDLVVSVHTAVPRHAPADDFAVPHRDEVEAALAGAPGDATGPYAAATTSLLTAHAATLGPWLARYDDLVAAARTGPVVLTHGEPHPGNTMLTTDGWRLIDWDTALVAPPERDLWGLDPGDGSVLAAYADATGVPPRPALLDLYRLRWDLADIAVEVGRFRRDHHGGADDDKAWEILRTTVERLVPRL